ncbi:virion structural protein [Synechococcus phage ACG-2014e]|uniref:Structural protein n=1 Tax=Synechococcus phage ACG-2014e TaxID=1493510 RepID=A0A0E3F5E6_9CAUD|nr:virion structural protein [Synechococcus phage ACG-2014e]AIX20640.1 structural protein [Synechococcus phage ACG-2014e]
MADRFPLIVNAISKKIEEIVSGDNLELTGNGIVVSGDTGAGKYLSSDGTTVFWDSPGDVYLDQSQVITNKIFEACVISGALNTLSDIPNSSLVNSGITVNGTTIALGGTVITPDNNTTYSISAQDGLTASEKIVRLTSGGNIGAGIDDDVTFGVAVPSSVPTGSNALSLFIDRSGEKITISGHVIDNNTITTIDAPGGTATSGAISFTSTGAATVSMTGSTVNIDALDTDTRTKIRAGSGGTYGPADTTEGRFTFLDGTGTTVSQGVDGSGDATITYTSTDTVTQIRGGSTGSYKPSTSGTATTQISIEGGTALGGNVQVTESGNIILIDSTDTNTVTKVGSDNNGSPIAPQAGDFILKQAGATTITQTTNGSGQVEVVISSINSDTGASLTANNGLILSGSDFGLKNYNNLSGNTVMKWDNGNGQFADSIITDDGSTVIIDGDLTVSGTQTIFNTSVLQVEDNIIELRKGNNLVGFDGGIQVNRTSDPSGVITSYKGFQWHESGGYWRSWDGSVEQRFVTETETQVLTNKTLTNPTFTTPTLGAATATSVNGLEIATTASAVFDLQSGKTLDVDNDLTFTSDNSTGNVNVNFRVGGDVAYKSDTLASFASTTATQLRTLISGTTGIDDLVFQTNPVILTGLTTTSTGFSLINSGAQSIQFGGAATQIEIGNTSGTTTVSGDLVVEKDLTVGGANTDLLTCNARIDVANSDILIRGGSSDPMTVGRGNSEVASNTAIGKQALLSVVSGSQNTAVGYETGLTINSGAGNTGYGYQVLRSNGVGDLNTAMGRAAMISNLSGDGNTAIGSNALQTNTTGDANVCIGYYAGFAATGSGNVLIGPADSSDPVNDATYTPPTPGGNRQLVIGSGTEFWIKGDANFDVTISNDLTVNRTITVKGDLVVNGTTTTVKSNVVEIADKNIELAKVVSTTFTCSTADGSANITSISPTLGLIPGMVVTSNTGGVSVPNGTTIVSITGNSAVLSNNVTGTGTPTFSAIGPSDTAADGGGIILAGNTQHTFLWSNANDAWQSSEDMEVAQGKTYNIIDGSGNAREMLSLTQIGPTAGSGVVAGLGTGVTSSALTSIGTLTSLTVSGNVNFTGTGYLQLPSGTDAQQPGASGQPAAAEGMLRWNNTSNVFEGYDGNIWGKIGGGAAVQSAAPSPANPGDLWYDTDDGRMFVYYTDSSSSQWVDASPNGMPTDLTLDGTLTVDGTTNLIGDLSVGTETTNSNAGSQTLSVGSLAAGQSGGIQIWANSTNGNSFVQFGDGTASADQYRGYINYTHSNDRLGFGTAGENRFLIDNTGNIEPGADATQDLGSATKRFANIYSADLQLSNEGAANEVDGTWGQYTIQEGEEDLFLINRRSGKKYKFMLQEVN